MGCVVNTVLMGMLRVLVLIYKIKALINFSVEIYLAYLLLNIIHKPTHWLKEHRHVYPNTHCPSQCHLISNRNGIDVLVWSHPIELFGIDHGFGSRSAHHLLEPIHEQSGRVGGHSEPCRTGGIGILDGSLIAPAADAKHSVCEPIICWQMKNPWFEPRVF